MLTRAEQEAREAKVLAPWAARAASSRGRAHSEEEHPYRTAFQRDRDRIVHCDAFRRLEYKTQVFVNHEGDHYRTRLTHTMEVAQIARTLARALSLNEDLAEAIALAHDIGHTPFGHAGEATLDDLLAADGGFEHNRQGLRVVERLERRYPGFEGLNLTGEVREAFAAHRTAYDHPDRKSALEESGHAPGRAHAGAPPGEQPTLEAQVVAAADSVAYDSHDLDDGLRSGLLNERALDRIALWRRAAEAVAPAAGGLDADMRRAQTVRALINLQVSDLVEATEARIAGRGVRSLEDVRAASEALVAPGEAVRAEKRELESHLMAHFYRHYRVCRMANKARGFVEAVFGELARHPDALPPAVRERAEADGLPRAVADYVAGMTDRYCQDTYVRLFQPFERM